jgi:hypothetical protein
MHKSEWLSSKADPIADLLRRMRSIAGMLRVSRQNGWRNPVDTPPVIPPEWTHVHAVAWELLTDEERKVLEKWRGCHVAPGEQGDAEVVEAFDREYGRYY